MPEVLPARARSFQGLRAGIVTRALAASVDVVVVAGLGAAALLVWSLFRSLGQRTFQFTWLGSIPLFVLGELILCLYLWSAWSSTGRTIGKQVMGLRVVNAEGRLLRPLSALLRAILCVVFPIGLLWCVVSQGNRSAQDVLLRTSVIYDWNVRVPLRARRRSPSQQAAPGAKTVGGRLGHADSVAKTQNPESTD
jgi:uncharacterized RDD family membrane protein YckC